MKLKSQMAKEAVVKNSRNVLYKEEISEVYKLVVHQIKHYFTKAVDREIQFDVANEFIYQAILNKCSDEAFINHLIALKADGYLYTSLKTFISRKSYLNRKRKSNGAYVFVHEIPTDFQEEWDVAAADMNNAICMEKLLKGIEKKTVKQRIQIALELIQSSTAGTVTDIIELCKLTKYELKEAYVNMPCMA